MTRPSIRSALVRRSRRVVSMLVVTVVAVAWR
jgi:hypothetical protein